MLGRELNKKNIMDHYDVDDALKAYNCEIINKQEEIKKYFKQTFPLIKNGAFITITPMKDFHYNFLKNHTSKLFKYTNEILFSQTERRAGEGIQGLGCAEKQHNGRAHYHIALVQDDAFGNDLERLHDKFKVTIKRLNKKKRVYSFENGVNIQKIYDPEEVLDYMLKETEITEFDNIFFIDSTGFTCFMDKEFKTRRYLN